VTYKFQSELIQGITKLLDGRYHVSGEAFARADNQYGPNMGFLDFVDQIKTGLIRHEHTVSWGEYPQTYVANFNFEANMLIVEEVKAHFGIFGNGVCFAGEYLRVSYTASDFQSSKID